MQIDSSQAHLYMSASGVHDAMILYQRMLRPCKDVAFSDRPSGCSLLSRSKKPARNPLTPRRVQSVDICLIRHDVMAGH